MRTHARTSTPLGQLIAAVFDEAALHSDNPHEVSRLATKAVTHLLERLRRSSHACRRLPSAETENDTDRLGTLLRKSTGR
ncbi:MAG: hypothetical protein JW940_06595 [Polyangiaceae bacterium]|nr:hypothetical protein [Polyangiaceae bacterium]